MPKKGRAEPVAQPATAEGKTPGGGLPRKEGAETRGRFFDALNTLIAVLVVLFVVAVNVFLYLGYHSSETPPPPATERSSGPQRTVGRTEQRAAPKEPTRPQRRTQSATTLQSTIPTEQSATPSATPSASASATSSPSP